MFKVLIVDSIGTDGLGEGVEFRLRVRMAGYDGNRLGTAVGQVLDDGSGTAAGTEDDAVLLFDADSGMVQGAAESAVVRIIAESAVVREVDGIDGTDDAGFAGNIRQVRHDIEFVGNGDIGSRIPFVAQALKFIGDIVAVHFQDAVLMLPLDL